MWLFLFVVGTYCAVLIGLRPAPDSLKSKPISYIENVSRIKVTLLVGIVLCVVHLLVTHFSFGDTKDAWIGLLGIKNVNIFEWMWFHTIVTNTFVHLNFLHLLTNLHGVGLCSLYERRVDARRYLAIFIVSALGSNLSMFAFSEPTVSTGVSGAVFGLAAAYFTDHKDITLKDWAGALAAFTVLAIIVEVNTAFKSDESNLDFTVNHLGHALGALSAIIYCRIRPAKT